MSFDRTRPSRVHGLPGLYRLLPLDAFSVLGR